MMLDVRTLFVVVVFITIVAGAWLSFSALQHRDRRPLALWGGCYFLVGFGVAVLATHELMPDAVRIIIGNSLILLGYGAAWQGARAFDGRPMQWTGFSLGTVIWLGACLIPTFLETLALRVMLVSGVVAAYSFATAMELWRGRGELASRVPGVVLLCVHAAIFIIRAIDAPNLPLPDSGFLTAWNWNMVLAFETLIFMLGMAFIATAIMKEKLSFEHRREALVDPLTEALNRRGFELRGLQVLRRHAAAHEPIAVIAFDLDHFKSVNDTFGHAMGDAVLVQFSQIASRHLRSSDMLFRMGGEEFTALLPGASADDARLVADRIRKSFVEAVRHSCDGRVVTVSAGIASSGTHGYDARELLSAADKALYRSKNEGRNRVTQDGDPLPPPPPSGSNIAIFPNRGRNGALPRSANGSSSEPGR
ncbi:MULTISPECIES: GGDEF domain-containing protein [unclassified Chelatococcus]|uniref:GGDEF domain-containing protein n=1 Tax=unclassified Chelatococcus TaxID=2638111 RepID=UPI001BD075EF|nr:MULTISPECIES: GGDEF domain-containing protein [unclassified Chelatococcus]MBS7699408.1 GGDEF domain-containing protein [Chelatococcus sp. YT9]MBX3557700.1 GGDEF domain-containing protein [Chelatococcus sp.]